MRKKTIWLVAFIYIFSVGPTVVEASELYGKVTWSSGNPAEGVLVSIGGYSVATDQKGEYKFSSLEPGDYTVAISPPGRATKSFRVRVSGDFTQQDFTIDW